jgi:hypothetical protein
MRSSVIHMLIYTVTYNFILLPIFETIFFAQNRCCVMKCRYVDVRIYVISILFFRSLFRVHKRVYGHERMY